MSKFPNLNEQMDLIKVGTEEIIPENELVKKIEKSLKNNKPLNIKLGCDPSRPDLHLGHSVVLRKLKDFQDLGHTAILLIGNFTAMIGDPTGQNKTRPQLTKDEVSENSKSYMDQAGMILDSKLLKIVHNGDWLSKMNFSDVIKLASNYTVARMLERDDFTKRYNGGQPISLHEFLYPLAQGYDSVHINSDVELGGTDQKFNLLVGRALQKESNLEPQVIITTPLIEGTDGVEKMSKSYDNYIGFSDSPSDMYGKTLSIPDDLIIKYFEYCTRVLDFETIKLDFEKGNANPRDLKRRLAREIVEIYHTKQKAFKAEEDFDNLFIKKDIPDNIPEITLEEDSKLLDIMLNHAMVTSKGEGKRMIKQGGVKLNDVKISDLNTNVSKGSESILKVGKRKFLKIN
ncbi:MAG: tyrosine--tRNA ligase [Candidatus Marinimicrobia bacterium]|nr:tyrosine--tRNA ligase [Candidatus Neomarinimicrobiota bacterium]